MIAIHNSNGGFHPRWIAFCEAQNIPFRLVNCYDNDLLEQIKDCTGLMWHHSQNDPKSLVAGKPILFSLEQAGIKVFPNFNTNWHFDDKLGQKYLLEGIGAPLVPTYAFYDKNTALAWAKRTSFPKVFKLRGGAGSFNVKLIRTRKAANKVIKKAFGKGFSNFDSVGNLKELWRKWRLQKIKAIKLVEGFARLFFKPAFSKIMGRELGYILFQDFIPDNDHDIRIVAIGDKAFAIKRMVRDNDFRASGSGNIQYERHHFDNETVRLAFNIHQKLKSQCTAMDFIYDQGVPKIVEISYGFVIEGYDPCAGYWDKDLNWYEGKFDPCGWMVEMMINEKN